MIVGFTNSFGAGGMDVYLIKVDQDGNELWSKTFGGSLDEMGGGGQMPDGSIIVSGSIVDPNDIVADPGAAGYAGFAGRSNVFITRADGEGNPLWTQTFGGEQNVLTAACIPTPDGGFVILAYIIAYPEPGNHIYLLKVDENGQQVWSQTWEEDNASGYSLVQTSDGGYLITGPYLPEGGEKEDFLFIKTDAEGNEVWRSTFGDPDMIDYGVVLTEATDGGYVSAGEWVKDYYAGDSDLSLVKIDAQGQLVWQQKIETNAHNMVAKILQHPDGGYAIATSIVSGRDFDFDIMLIKIGEPASSTATNSPIPGVISAETASQVERLSLLSGHTDRVTTLAFSKDSVYLASSSWDGTIKVWDAWNGHEVYTLPMPNADLNAIAFSPTENWLAAPETIWNVESGQAVQTFRRGSQEPGHVAFSPDGSTLAIVNFDQPIKLWDVTSGEVLRTFEHPADSLTFGIEFSADGMLLAAAEPHGTVRLWDVASGQVIGTLEYGNDSDVHDVAFSPDGRYVASAGTDNTVRLWDLASRQLLHTLWHGNGMYGVTFSPDSSLVASAVCDRTVKLWEVASGKLLRTLPHRDELFTVVFSPDGRLLASAGYDDLIYLWGIAR
jgi:DNA-binding beta-propeller fold protein YncE